MKTVSHHLRELEFYFYGNAKGSLRITPHYLSNEEEKSGLSSPPTNTSLEFILGVAHL